MQALISFLTNNYKDISLFLLVVFLGLFAGINSIAALLLTMGSFLLLLTLTNLTMVYKVTLASLIIIPEGIIELLKLSLPILKLTIFEVQLLLIIAIVLGNLLLNRLDVQDFFHNKVYLLLLLTCLLYSGLGYMYKNEYLITDLRIIFIFISYILAFLFLKQEKELLSTFFKMNIIISLGIALIVLIVFCNKNTFFTALFFDSLEGKNLRVGFSNTSCFILTAPAIILARKLKCLNKSWNLWGLIALAGILLSALIDESRALILAIVLNMAIATLLTSYLANKKYFILKLIKIIISVLISISLLYCAYTFFGLAENPKVNSIVNRFTEIATKGKIMSYDTRKITNRNAWGEITAKPYGHGVGSTMNLYKIDGVKVKQANFIDNAVLTYLHKFGFLGFGIILLFYLREFYNMYRLATEKRKFYESTLALCFLLCTPLYLINGAYFTAQIINSGAVNAFTLTTFAIIDLSLLRKISQQSGEERSDA